MPTIKIDDKDYDSEKLSDAAKSHIAGINFVDSELARLQAKAAALQTARVAYSLELKKLLEV